MDKKFCPHCGAAVSENDSACPVCKSNMTTDGGAFRLFLYKHTKDKLKGDIEGKLFDLVKNFLLSHLFGVSLAVCVVVSSAVGKRGLGIAKAEDVLPVRNRFHGDVQENVVPTNTHSLPKDRLAIVNEINNRYIDRLLNEEDVSGYLMPSSYDIGVHEADLRGELEAMHSSVEHSGDRTELHVGGNSGDPDFELNPSDPKLPLSRSLMDRGYDVVENRTACWLYLVNGSSKTLISGHEYIISFVKIDGQWYVAEDIEV